MSTWPRSRGANTRRIAPTRATLPTTAFRLAGIVPSMRCGLMRPHLKRWRRSRITSPSTRTVSTRSANRPRRPGFDASGQATRHKAATPRRRMPLPVRSRRMAHEGDDMVKTTPVQNKALVLQAFDTLFNKRDYTAAERYWSSNYIQHSAHIPPGREGLFNLVESLPAELRYGPGLSWPTANS